MQSLKIKQEDAPAIVTSNRRGYQLSASDCDKPFNFIVGHLRERGNTYNDLPQLPISLQKVWKAPQRTPTLPLQSVQENIHGRTHQTARRYASEDGQGSALSATASRRQQHPKHGKNHRSSPRHKLRPVSAGGREVRASIERASQECSRARRSM